MRKYFLIILAFTITCTQAQKKTPVFLKAGFGISNVKLNSGKTSLDFGYSIGLEKYLKLYKTIMLNPDFSYEKTGYDNSGSKVKVNYINFALPVMLDVTAMFDDEDDPSDENFSLMAGVGPFAGYAVSGNYTIATGDKKSISFGNGAADNRKPYNAGLILKSGFRVKKIFFGTQYNIGFTNLVPKDRITNGASIKSRDFLIDVSIALK
ncbi:MAG: outer membrane beta-barrel protein [Ferruginibacter sp.]